MAYLRVRSRKRGYVEIGKKVRFNKRVEFMQGAGLLFARSVEYYVDGKDGSDTYNGLSADRAKATIAAAVTAMNARISWSDTPWARGDILHIAPGLYAENLTALPYGCVVIGHGDPQDMDGQNGVVIKPATGAAIDVTSAINTQIFNVGFAQVATAGALFQADNFNHMLMVNCFFQGIPGPSPTTTRGFEVVKEMCRSRLIDCYFMQCKTGVYINTDNANEKQIISSIFEGLTIHGADVAGFHFDEHCTPAGVSVNNCKVGESGQTLGLGMDDDSDGVSVSNTSFWATTNDPATGGTYYNNCYLNGVLIT